MFVGRFSSLVLLCLHVTLLLDFSLISGYVVAFIKDHASSSHQVGSDGIDMTSGLRLLFVVLCEESTGLDVEWDVP